MNEVERKKRIKELKNIIMEGIANYIDTAYDNFFEEGKYEDYDSFEDFLKDFGVYGRAKVWWDWFISDVGMYGGGVYADELEELDKLMSEDEWKVFIEEIEDYISELVEEYEEGFRKYLKEREEKEEEEEED